MILDNEDKQGVAYNLLFNEIKENKISHAYLIIENNNMQAFNLVLKFVKAIICKDIKGQDEIDIISQRIDDNNYPELKIIEPDGLLIKKQQIINLQQDFSRKAIEGKKRIYIIRECDKMRPETANAMLKFLEEPENDIVAILMTNNENNILPTIISRCQKVKLNNEVLVDENNEYDDLIMYFVDGLENSGLKLFVNKNNFWLDKNISKDRVLLVKLFDLMIDIYYDMIKVKNNINDIKYSKYYDRLENLVEKNNMDAILYKINYLLNIKDSIKYNVNVNLLFDSVIINVGGYYESCRS